MDTKGECKKFINRGLLFQLALIFSFAYRLFALDFIREEPFFVQILGLIGATLFVYCAYVIYNKQKGRSYLLTNNVFRFTRHPMYTGLVLMDLKYWFTCPHDINFWISSAILYSSICIAGYFQEKETLARFGNEAKAYYAKTPRLFLFYPIKLLSSHH